MKQVAKAVCAVLLMSSTASAVTIYDESVSGDFSDSGNAPDPINLQLGANDVLGGYDTPSGGLTLDSDNFSFIIDVDQVLESIELISYEGPSAGASLNLWEGTDFNNGTFFAGRQFSFGIIGFDLLTLVFPDTNRGPVGPGEYFVNLNSGLVNDGEINYGLRFTVGNSTEVPEPSSLALLGIGLLGLKRRRRTQA